MPAAPRWFARKLAAPRDGVRCALPFPRLRRAGPWRCSNACGARRQTLRQPGFSASSAAENECQHDRGVRASYFKEPRTPRTKRDGKRTTCFRTKHSAQYTRGRSPDSQVIAEPACLPIPKNSGSVRRPLAAYSGGTVRDFHPLPFSLAPVTSTSGIFTVPRTPKLVNGSVRVVRVGRRLGSYDPARLYELLLFQWR